MELLDQASLSTWIVWDQPGTGGSGHQYRCYNYAHLFFLIYGYIYTYKLSAHFSAPLPSRPSQHLTLGVQISQLQPQSCWLCPQCRSSCSGAPAAPISCHPLPPRPGDTHSQEWVQIDLGLRNPQWRAQSAGGCLGTLNCTFSGAGRTRAGPWAIFQSLCSSWLGFNWRNIILFLRIKKKNHKTWLNTAMGCGKR